MKLLGNRLLVEPITPLHVTPAGLILPQSHGKQPFAYVRQLGAGRPAHAQAYAALQHLQLGQLVRIDTSYGSQEVKVAGQTLRIVSVLDVQVIVQDANP